MTQQARKLEVALDAFDPRDALIREFPVIYDQFAMFEEDGRHVDVLSLIDVQRRYCREWTAFVEAVGFRMYAERR